MKRYPEAAKGLYKVFIGQALSSAFAYLLAGSAISGLVSLAGLLLYLFGLRQARLDDRRYVAPLILALVVLALNFVGGQLRNQGDMVIATVVGSVRNLINLAAIYLVCRITGGLCQSMDQPKLARFQLPVVAVNGLCAALTIGLDVALCFIQDVDRLQSLGYLQLLISLIGTLMYMLFLFRASRVLAPVDTGSGGYYAAHPPEEDYGESDDYDGEDDEDYEDDEPDEDEEEGTARPPQGQPEGEL